MLRYLFADMNAYFASCEQQDHPELRGRPIAVVPIAGTDRTCCIAASYEAKAFGIKTGCPAHEAKKRCPGIILIPSRQRRYIELHHHILRAVDTVIPVHRVRSIDEFDCQLLGRECDPARAMELGKAVKWAIKHQVGRWMRCSVGLAPSAWLAKVAGDMKKPDGLSMIRQNQLPQALYRLALSDLPGIGRRMDRRLRQHGVETVEHLCALPAAELSAIWGSRVHGFAWWARLRGEDVADPANCTRSVGHSRTLAPELRNDPDARAVLVLLIHKAAERMRANGYWAHLLVVYADHLDGRDWSVDCRLCGCRDTLALLRAFAPLWETRRKLTPIRVGVVLDHLRLDGSTEIPLFPRQRLETQLATTMDRINRRYGRTAVYFGSMHNTRSTHATRIAFGHVPDLDLPNG